MDLVNAKTIQLFMQFAEKGGLALTLLIVLAWLAVEIKRNSAKDKLIAAKDAENSAFQQKMFDLMGEMKVASSNANLLLEMLTRGRK